MPTTDCTALPARLAAEQQRTQLALEPLSDLAAEIAGRLRQTRTQRTSGVPHRVADHWYLRRRPPGHPLVQLCRRPATAEPGTGGWEPPDPDQDPEGWQVLVDGGELARETGFADVPQLSPAPDGRLVAYTIDTTGGEGCDLVVLDGETGSEVDRLHGVCPRFAWWPDSAAIAYGTVDPAIRPDTVWVHRLGTSRRQDVVALHEPDTGRWVGVGASTSGRLLLLVSGSATSTRWWALDGAAVDPQARVLLPGEPGVHHQADHARIAGADVLIVLRTECGRPDLLQLLPLAAIGAAGAAGAAGAPGPPTTVLSGDDQLELLHLSVSRDAVVLNVRAAGVPTARVYRTSEMTGGRWPEPAVTVGSALAARPRDWAQPFVQITRTSWTAPSRVVDVDVRTGRQTVRRTAAVPAGYRPDRYRSHRLLVPSGAAGVLVPMTVLERRDQVRPGPCLLTVYGSYGRYDDPELDLLHVELMDRGVRVAIAHTRGGGELGPDWHDAARGARKGRTVDDLLACARHLLTAGWTTPSGLVLRGASAGGLVVAAAANREPELFAGVAALVPFVDPLRSMLDPTMPLTTTEREEWGDPLVDPAVRAAMAAYSPVQNVRPVAYPAMYVTVSERDHRINAQHVLDWVDRLRATGTARGPVLLRSLQTGGHGGPSDPRQQAWEQGLLAAWVVRTTGAG